ncbi:pimeloyl-ACP methyl ester carboxylesterase [Conyzicola lurida]|uniref:Pimeloyl-ACP methyl ester carboxylesterase n=1 Tax=Conyzicola lurida TaxID=1172621 RepID=A0A841AEI2_9MICO|nr:alpha/beta hydrolase [Conyzicola lurida]MBB5842150.1 pimeloyl-ACP methyl ester carboxylesterase [Conyzicola lurida]
MLDLPTTHWGDPSSERSALLLHGLTSSGATWWRVGEALASDGWFVTAVDLRGNGDGPVATSYRFADYAADLPGRGWDVVIGHSLGGAVAVVAAARPGFAKRIVLIDPALALDSSELPELLNGELAELTLDLEGFEKLRPTWDPVDVAHKSDAVSKATAHMVERTVADNTPWNVLDETVEITVPTLIVGGDHAVYSMLPTETADALVAANAHIAYRVVPGAGHSPHRDRPDETLSLLREWLAAH